MCFPEVCVHQCVYVCVVVCWKCCADLCAAWGSADGDSGVAMLVCVYVWTHGQAKPRENQCFGQKVNRVVRSTGHVLQHISLFCRNPDTGLCATASY